MFEGKIISYIIRDKEKGGVGFMNAIQLHDTSAACIHDKSHYSIHSTLQLPLVGLQEVPHCLSVSLSSLL